MDVMALRRMMAQMAAGAQFIKGSFTIPDSGLAYTFNFGKTFSKYLCVFEADDSSKAVMISSTSVESPKAFQVVGIYPNPTINNRASGSSKLVSRYTPSTGIIGSGGSSTHSFGDSSIVFTISAFETGNQNNLYYGFTYNYYVVEIK